MGEPLNLAGLLREWSEREPGECRPGVRGEGFFLIGLADARTSAHIHPYEGHLLFAQDRALILWHVLACIERRGWFAARVPEGWRVYRRWEDYAAVFGEWIGQGYDGGDAERLLSAYLAALRATAEATA